MSQAFPKRWETPFGKMDDNQVAYLQQIFSNIDAARFPKTLPLEGIFRHDCRIRTFRPGDIIIREGDYGGNAFYILEGNVCVVRKPGLPEIMLGRTSIRKKSAWHVFGKMIAETLFPSGPTQQIAEYRSPTQMGENYSSSSTPLQESYISTVNLYDSPMAEQIFTGPKHPQTEKKRLSEDYHSISLNPSIWLGEIAALARVPRTATVFAETEVKAVEIRWQGLRDIRIYDKAIRDIIDASYSDSLLKTILASSPYFSHIKDDDELNELAQQADFESHGDFEWSQSYKDADKLGFNADIESVIAHEGDYADSAFIVAGGFGRVTLRFGQGHRTLNYLKRGDVFGLSELYAAWQSPDPTQQPVFNTTLSCLGYLQVLRIPAQIIQSHLFESQKVSFPLLSKEALKQSAARENALLEWAVEKRLINGTQVMLIDQDRCVRCDDCVRACAKGHENNPRFIRHGKSFANWMVTNACMHCSDPVCMIGCPTGAIHRIVDGTVVINDESCVGCANCANACPYHNIRMVEIRDKQGNIILNETTQEPSLKATKCDLCASQPGGPACVRACPHDALQRVDFQTQVSLS